MDKKYIINIKGNDFVKFGGVLNEAHNKGLDGLDTEVVQFPSKDNQNTAVVKATISIKGKKFSGIGDANPTNVNSQIVPHIIRQAETRAIARSIRFGCNIDLCVVEELGDSKKNKLQTTKPIKTDLSNEDFCSNPKCDNQITAAERDYSLRFYSKAFCRTCQTEEKRRETK